MDHKGIEQFDKYNENPFLGEVMTYIKEKNTKVGYIKDESDFGLINSNTGELKPFYNTIYINKYVDVQQYNKVYVDNISKLFDLSKTAQKVIKYIYSKLEKNSDTIYFELKECKIYCKYKSNQIVYTGIAELINQKIIARTNTHYKYYINPTIMFNGDRLLIVKEYSKTKLLKNDI